MKGYWVAHRNARKAGELGAEKWAGTQRDLYSQNHTSEQSGGLTSVPAASKHCVPQSETVPGHACGLGQYPSWGVWGRLY